MHIEHIGRYEVLEMIARGGMGVVYKARDPLIDRVVAIKTLGSGLSRLEAEEFRRRFAREAKSAGSLAHPNIVTIHDMGESDDGAYIAMEFLEGRSLRDVLDSGIVLPPEEAARIAMQVAEGLAFAHSRGVVHCDVKPGNIMVLHNGTIKITDFGVARLPTGSRTFVGNVLGSPRYISPEQIVSRPVDARSDLFSLGVVLYEMLTGVTPFPGTAIDEILFQVINDKPQPPSSRNQRIPAAFDEIVARAMAKHPDDRYRNAEAFALALRPLAAPDSSALAELPPIAVGWVATNDSASNDQHEPPDLAPESFTDTAGPDSAAGSVTVQLGELAGNPAFADPIDARSSWRPQRRWMIAGMASALVVALVGAAVLAPRESASTPSIVPTMQSGMSISSVNQVVSEPAVEVPAARTDARLLDLPARPARPPESASGVATAAVPASPGRLRFAVTPWGEIHVDGKRLGVTPPLTELKLAAGKHVVEIRNTTFAPHRETVELPAGGTLRIKHRFH